MLVLVVALITAFSALLIRVVATPLPADHRPTTVHSNSRSTLYRRAPPKFEIPLNLVSADQREDTLEKMKEHYRTKASDAQKGAGLASAATRWNILSPGREYLAFNYHAGGTTRHPIIEPTVDIRRDTPVPKVHFENVPNEHKEEIKVAGAKRYRNLNHDSSNRVKSMKAWGPWGLKGGIREKTEFTFHSTVRPGANNVIGEPTTLNRHLTLQFPDVSIFDKYTIDNRVRAAHKKMVADPQHPATTSNYGIVHSNWHKSSPDANGKTHEQVVVGLEEVSEDEKKRKHLGDYAFRKDTSDYTPARLDTGNPTSHAGPLGSSNEVARPSSSQEQQRINIGSSSTHTLPPNSRPSQPHPVSPQQPLRPHISGSPLHNEFYTPMASHSQILPRPNSQSSQISVESPGSSSHPGPSHSESLHTSSPQQSMQLHTSSPPLHSEFYMPSPEVWQPWDPLSQSSHDTWQSSHPDLYSDQLWRAKSPPPQSPRSNSQIPAHPNSPPSQFRAGSPGPSPHPGHSHSELSHPASPQLPLQVHTGSPPLHNEFYMPSPEVWRSWDPLSQPSHDTWQSSYPDLYSDRLWSTGSPPPRSPPSNS